MRFRKPNNVMPELVQTELPKLIWILRSRESARLQTLLDSGKLNPLLLDGDTRKHANAAAMAFAAEVAQTVVSRSDDRAETAAAIRTETHVILKLAPVPDDVAMTDAWLDQLLDGTVRFKFKEMDARSLWTTLAVSAAALQVAELPRKELLRSWNNLRQWYARTRRIDLT